MDLQRKYKLNMPQLLWGAMSENWLLKELGDAHWEQITKALNTASDELVNSKGERLYASFVRLRIIGDNIRYFSENDKIKFESKISRYRSKMFFSETICSGSSGKLKANLMSVFSVREASDNKTLKKGTLNSEINSRTVYEHEQLPNFAKEYLEDKASLFKVKENLEEVRANSIYRKTYQIDVYDDINGVGLLYFASYPKINDKCEREYINAHYDIDQDWLTSAGTVFRDVHYYANANPSEGLIYELNSLEEKEGRVTLQSSLYRATDNQLIAQIFTVKELADKRPFRRKRERVVSDQFFFNRPKNILQRFLNLFSTFKLQQ